MAHDEEFDPEFKKLLRKLITERLAQEAVSGGSWKNALENLKDIFEIDRAQLEREIASLVVLKSWEEKRGAIGKADGATADKVDKQDQGQENFAPTGAKKSSNWGIFQQGGKGGYGEGVKAQVFEVIVRQGVIGAPWRELCAGPMKINNIDPVEVQTEIDRRLKLIGKGPQNTLDELDKEVRAKDNDESVKDKEDEPPKQGGKSKKKGKK